MISLSMSGAAKAALASLALAVALCGNASAASLAFQKLTLIGDWKPYLGGTAIPTAAVDSNNVVHLRGAMQQPPNGFSPFPFVLPLQFRPNRSVFVQVDLLNGKSGRLNIGKDGVVQVTAAGSFSDAQAFTSLEGVTFSRN